MITGYAKELKQKYPNHQIVAKQKKGVIVDTIIFNNNPNIKRFSELKKYSKLFGLIVTQAIDPTLQKKQMKNITGMKSIN